MKENVWIAFGGMNTPHLFVEEEGVPMHLPANNLPPQAQDYTQWQVLNALSPEQDGLLFPGGYYAFKSVSTGKYLKLDGAYVALTADPTEQATFWLLGRPQAS